MKRLADYLDPRKALKTWWPGICLCLLVTAGCCSSGAEDVLRFNEENSSVPLTESMLYNRVLTWRPADSAEVTLNPPRFSWPYEPTIFPEDDSAAYLPVRKYRFQLAEDPGFRDLLLDIHETDFNFYNTIPTLPEGEPIYWRVGYYDPEGKADLEWRKTRTFTVRPGAAAWDRSGLAVPKFVSDPHPRIIFTRERLQDLRKLAESDTCARELYQKTLAAAGEDLQADWFTNFPRTDKVPEAEMRKRYSDIPPWLDPDGSDAPYLQMIDRLMNMAFAYMLSGDDRFLAVVDRLVTVASWGREGETRSEGMGGSPDNVSLNEYLGLFYDWFYDVLTPGQRKVVIESLRWRLEHIVNNYSWRQRRGTRVYPYSIAVGGSSHPYENINYTFPAALAAYEEGGIFRTTYELAVNFLTGVNNCFGPEDAWNEGPGYGLSKFKWMVYAVCYYDMTLDRARLGANPFLARIGEFFNRVAVLGLPHLSFGNIGIMEPYYLNNRVSSYRKLAYLTSNKRFLKSWEDALLRLGQIGYSGHRKYSRPWIEYALPLVYGEPRQEPETPAAELFPDGGWVAASSAYPGYLDNYETSVGIIFHARPRGAFNHAFFGDNNFQIYAYGQNITHAGGSTRNGDRHAHHSMSQNIVLVDGMGQAQPSHSRMQNFRKKLYNPFAARIARFAESGGTVYFKGEAAKAYIQYPYRYREFWGFLGDGENNPYDQRDLAYLTRADRHVLFVDRSYFVILDDLAVSGDRPEGSRFSWLYHVLQDVPLNWDPERRSFTYKIGDVTTVVQHIGKETPLVFENRKKDRGLINPITGEDYNKWVKPIQRFDNNRTGPYPDKVTHNIWITNSAPRRTMRFMAVIYPYREGGPQPVIERVDDLTVRIGCKDRVKTVTFDPAAHPEAEIQVEL